MPDSILPDGSTAFNAPTWDDKRATLPALAANNSDFSTWQGVEAGLGAGSGSGIDYGANFEIPTGYHAITPGEYAPAQAHANRNVGPANDFGWYLTEVLGAAAGGAGAWAGNAAALGDIATFEAGMAGTPAYGGAALEAGAGFPPDAIEKMIELQANTPGDLTWTEAAKAAGFASPEAYLASQGMASSVNLPPSGDGTTPPPTGPQMLDATTPTVPLSPEVMQSLGISQAEFGADSLGINSFGDSAGGMVPGGAPGGIDPSIYTGAPPTDIPSPLADQVIPPETGGSESWLKQGADALKKLGISPATAAQLGISGIQALSKPKLPGAAQTLANQSGPGAAAANSMIQSGGTGGAQWTQQKSSIDATIDQQIQQQTQALVQQAINSGQGADSQLVQQQTNKLKNDLETKRQQLYAQAQQQNVQAALQSLGIQNQSLAQVANAQYKSSEEAKQAAAATAQNALMLQALSKNRAPAKEETADAA